MKGLVWLALSAALVGCGYPEFKFSVVPADAGDATANDVATPIDTARDEGLVDTSIADVAPDTNDTGSIDSMAIDARDSALDTADTADVGVDAGPVGCTGSTSAFCRDFDKVPTAATGWMFPDVDPDGSCSLEPAGHSAPNALLCEMKIAGTTPVNAILVQTFTAPKVDSLARFDMWIKLEEATFPGKGTNLFKYERPGTVGDGLALTFSPGGLSIEVIADTFSNYPLGAIPVGKWFHFRMDARLHTTLGSLTVWIDDMTTPIVNKAAIPTLKADSTGREVLVGVHYTLGLTKAFRARFDDITFDFVP